MLCSIYKAMYICMLCNMAFLTKIGRVRFRKHMGGREGLIAIGYMPREIRLMRGCSRSKTRRRGGRPSHRTTFLPSSHHSRKLSFPKLFERETASSVRSRTQNQAAYFLYHNNIFSRMRMGTGMGTGMGSIALPTVKQN